MIWVESHKSGPIGSWLDRGLWLGRWLRFDLKRSLDRRQGLQAAVPMKGASGLSARVRRIGVAPP